MTAIRHLVLAVALAGTVGGMAWSGNAVARNAETTARNEAIVRAAFDGWAAGTGSVFDLLSPRIHWTIHGSGPVAGTYRGIDDFMQRASLPLVSRLATPLTPQVHHLWAVDDRVIIRFDASATTTGGHPYRNRFVWIFRMQDGLVVEAEAFLDLVAYQDVIEDNEPRVPTTRSSKPTPSDGPQDGLTQPTSSLGAEAGVAQRALAFAGLSRKRHAPLGGSSLTRSNRRSRR